MSVSVREEEMEFLTYELGEPEPHPMYLEKRVYQGSSGKVYPWPVIDRVGDTKALKKWRVVVLENAWLIVWILPALGGRVHRAFDKTNGYDFVYYNQVIKPALVGLAGPWISGGIEFNWPQHHRPSTFSPVEYTVRTNSDESCSVVVSEIDRMYGTKGEATFTLRPDKAVLEIQGRLYNPTPFPQTFLWWANPAVAVNDHTQSIFPPDVTAVMDHGKRDTSRFPIATGTYYKTDYSAGVDISRYKNIPVPTSYMAWKSSYDFMGGYDHQKQAGLLHVADHRLSPGKKQWTWGHGDFGKAWDRQLTDEDGPYIELMTGVYTDNQPDFTWLAPEEEKTFTQNFMPYKGIGEVKNATVDGAVHLSKAAGVLRVGVYLTGMQNGVRVRVQGKTRLWVDTALELGPAEAWTTSLDCTEDETDLLVEVVEASGRCLVRYQAPVPSTEPHPEPAKAILPPQQITDAEGLWLAGQHLEQYRHATFDPEDYYREGLLRFPRDFRLNGALGLLLLRRGLYAVAEAHFRSALESLTRHNTTPADGELSFHLGTALAGQGRWAEAESAWAKATWSGAWQAAGSLQMARTAARRGSWNSALEGASASLIRNSEGLAARHLKVLALRKLGRIDDAKRVVEETLALDPLDGGALREGEILGIVTEAEVRRFIRGEPRNLLHLGGLYAAAGAFEDAVACVDAHRVEDPLVGYHRASWLRALNRNQDAEAEALHAARLGPDLVFPNRLEDLSVLEEAVVHNPEDGRAHLYRGNLLYDRKRYEEAAACWWAAVSLEPTLATAWRNLALAQFNKLGQPLRARESLAQAVLQRPSDARLRFEQDQLEKRLKAAPEQRLASLESCLGLVRERDDLSLEYVTLLNLAGRSRAALAYLETRNFHAWEGGEGKVLRQYGRALVGVSLEKLQSREYPAAYQTLLNAESVPENLGEARLPGSRESQLRYYLGVLAQRAGRADEASRWWRLAGEGEEAPAGMMFYNDTPPELLFYQGLARRRAGDEQGAARKFRSLVDFGESHLDDVVKTDYFAVSLPDFLLFEDDLNHRNQVHCRFLTGLGFWGLGETEQALQLWAEALQDDPAHQGLSDHLEWARSGVLDL